MIFTLKCACWKMEVDGKMVSYYSVPNHPSEYSFERKINIDTIEELQNLADVYNVQWDREEYPTRKLIIDIDKKTITIYNNWIE